MVEVPFGVAVLWAISAANETWQVIAPLRTTNNGPQSAQSAGGSASSSA